MDVGPTSKCASVSANQGTARNSNSRTKIYWLSDFRLRPDTHVTKMCIFTGNLVKCTFSHQTSLRQISTLRQKEEKSKSRFQPTRPKSECQSSITTVRTLLSSCTVLIDIKLIIRISVVVSFSVTKISLGLQWQINFKECIHSIQSIDRVGEEIDNNKLV